MTQADEYLRRAAEATMLAEQESDLRAKAALLNIAETWTNLAEARLRAAEADDPS